MNFLPLASSLILAAYIVLPAAVIAAFLFRRRSIQAVLGLYVCGIALGAGVALAIASVAGGAISTRQILLAGYFAISMLLIFRGLDWAIHAILGLAVKRLMTLGPSGFRASGLRASGFRASGIRAPGIGDSGFGASGRPGGIRAVDHSEKLWFLVTRTLILSTLGMPYLMSALMIYRPKTVPKDTPITFFQAPYESVRFTSDDDVSLAGWWIAAGSGGGADAADANRDSAGGAGTDAGASADAADAHRDSAGGARVGGGGGAEMGAGDTTAIVCHNFGLTKASELETARVLVGAGYNVLMFDFRAHGESGGQLTTFGDRERLDVLAAVAWLRRNHPERCRHIVGVGSGAGAAALIGAAADPGPRGQAIESLAVFGAFDNMPALIDSLSEAYFLPPVGWLLRHVGLPLASLQTGVDLSEFSPARETLKVAPRPIFYVHDVRDREIDFDRGQALYESAPQPKARFWIDSANRDGAGQRAGAMGEMLWFFQNVKPML